MPKPQIQDFFVLVVFKYRNQIRKFGRGQLPRSTLVNEQLPFVEWNDLGTPEGQLQLVIFELNSVNLWGAT